jgi:hypothetical protein
MKRERKRRSPGWWLNWNWNDIQICSSVSVMTSSPNSLREAIHCVRVTIRTFLVVQKTRMCNPARLYSTHTKFGNTASVFRAFNTAAYGPKCFPFFRNNSRLIHHKEKIKISSCKGNNKLSREFIFKFLWTVVNPQFNSFKVWKHRRLRHMFPC